MSELAVYERGAQMAAAAAGARRAGQTVGLVPTMGALHGGHRALIERAATECDVVLVSIFANPLQFGDPADLARYPRTLAADLGVCQEAGAGGVFVPTVQEMYPRWPRWPATVVTVGGLSEVLEGASRPGHFAGVATVVTKLFGLTGACRAYFGEKDYQQLVVVRTLVADLSLPVEVVGCPTVRDADGLALSSRNVRLGAPERAAAACIPRALAAGRARAAQGEERPERIEEAAREVLGEQEGVQADYVALRDAGDLSVPARVVPGRDYRLLVAALVGGVRLLDNCLVGARVAGEPLMPALAGVAGKAGGRR